MQYIITIQMEPSRFGKKWSEDEIKQLLMEIYKGMTHQEIARIHLRSVGGIKSRIWSMAGDYHEEGRTIEEIKRFTKLSEEDIHNAIESRKLRNQLRLSSEKKHVEKRTNPKPTNIDIMNRLEDIHALLTTLLSISEKNTHMDPQSVLE